MNFLFIPIINSVFDIPFGLRELGHNVQILENVAFDPNITDKSQNQILSHTLSKATIDYVISHGFIPSVSDICFHKNIPYISWTYDSPLTALFTEVVLHTTNHVFIFDYDEYLRLKKLQVPHVYYQPLAANTSRVGALNITAQDEQTFSHAISFIGSLYDDNKYNELIQSFPPELQQELKDYLVQNLCKWEKKRPWPALSEPCVTFCKDIFLANPVSVAPLMDEATYLGIFFLSRKLAEMERITVLNSLAKLFPVDLYTRSNTDFLQNVTTHSGVDYYTDMNKVFFLSKINLNITLPSIESGVPQRIFDIMACGGFVITNYQEGIEDLFEIGKEIEVYHDIPELLQKCHYYLTHEKERLAVAIGGYQKVTNHYSYPLQLQKIITTVQENL